MWFARRDFHGSSRFTSRTVIGRLIPARRFISHPIRWMIRAYEGIVVNGMVRRVPMIAVMALVCAGGPTTATWAEPGPAPGCAPTVVLAVGGTKGPSTPDSIDPKSPVNAYVAPYQGRPDYLVTFVRYPGGMVAGVNGWDTDLDDSVRIGADNLRRDIDSVEAACGPATRYALYGYSQGAMVVRKVATEIDNADRRDDGTDLQDRVWVDLIADPAQGVAARFPGQLMPGITLPEPATPFAHVQARSECLPGDMVCDPNGDLAGYATKHTTYQPGQAGR
jgi:hypothetical protein